MSLFTCRKYLSLYTYCVTKHYFAVLFLCCIYDVYCRNCSHQQPNITKTSSMIFFFIFKTTVDRLIINHSDTLDIMCTAATIISASLHLDRSKHILDTCRLKCESLPRYERFYVISCKDHLKLRTFSPHRMQPVSCQSQRTQVLASSRPILSLPLIQLQNVELIL